MVSDKEGEFLNLLVNKEIGFLKDAFALIIYGSDPEIWKKQKFCKYLDSHLEDDTFLSKNSIFLTPKDNSPKRKYSLESISEKHDITRVEIPSFESGFYGLIVVAAKKCVDNAFSRVVSSQGLTPDEQINIQGYPSSIQRNYYVSVRDETKYALKKISKVKIEDKEAKAKLNNIIKILKKI